MHESLTPYEDRVNSGLLRRVIHSNGRLVLYNYTDHCTYSRAWDKYTLESRGIVFEIETGQCIARPFPKFFNLGEVPETKYSPSWDSAQYNIYEKCDGSLGIIFHYDNEWHICTRGSFTSDQAIKGAELLQHHSMIDTSEALTYLVEIIYPSNKIVVNYGNTKELVLLGAIDRRTGMEWELYIIDFHGLMNMRRAKWQQMTIKDTIAAQSTLPKDQEGFVVCFDTGLRVKIKGDEYLKIHRVLLNMTPLSLWATMKDGKCDTAILEQIPEEYRAEWEPIVKNLENGYKQVLKWIRIDLQEMAYDGVDITNNKEIGLFIKKYTHKLYHPLGIFPYVTNCGLDKYIMKTLRPTGNTFVKDFNHE